MPRSGSDYMESSDLFVTVFCHNPPGLLASFDLTLTAIKKCFRIYILEASRETRGVNELAQDLKQLWRDSNAGPLDCVPRVKK